MYLKLTSAQCQPRCSSFNMVIHRGQVRHVCVSKQGNHWFKQWFVTCLASSHCHNQCWHKVKKIPRNEFQLNLSWSRLRAPLLYYIKLCASFKIHRWIQAGVTVRKHSIQVKFCHFCPTWPWNLTDDLEKQYGTSSKQYQALCIIASSYVNSNCSFGPETVKLGVDLCDLDL